MNKLKILGIAMVLATTMTTNSYATVSGTFNKADTIVIANGSGKVTLALNGSTKSVMSSTCYNQGSGEVEVTLTIFTKNVSDPGKVQSSTSGLTRSTPGGVSISKSPNTGYKIYDAKSIHKYEVRFAGSVYAGKATLKTY